jgi:hypothetical protein
MHDRGQREQLESSIAMALLYSDIFSYPLTACEIFQRLSTQHESVADVEDVLRSMKSEGLVFQFDEYFSIRDERALAQRRNRGNERARSVLPRALKRGRLLFSFPFIRAVMISGSLSKNYMDEDSDVDFFVITEPGRLWVSRLFVALFKRIFLLNSHRYFCVNYYIDHQDLEIEEKNIFTATELATLIPVSGTGYYSKLIEKNQWIREFFPNHSCVPAGERPEAPSIFKRITERLIDPFGDWLDSWTFRMASRRYRKRYGNKFSEEEFNVAFKSRKGVSKNHDRHFQKHVTELFNSKVSEFAKQHPNLAAL